jgi:spore germination protein
MYITVVQPGETLASIAARTGVSESTLQTLNGLRSTQVTRGLALLVPSTNYIVEPGDTLASISKKSGIPPAEITRANPGVASALYPGRRLRLPAPRKRTADSIGYLPLVDPGVRPADIEPWARAITWVSIFAAIISADGSVTPRDEPVVPAARALKVEPLLSIANIEPGGAFSPEIARSIITDPAVRQRVLNTVVQLSEQRGYTGVDSDIENIPEELRGGYVDFLVELKSRLGPNKLLTSAIPPKYNETTFGYARGHDYAGIGSVVDRTFIMNYEFHWVGGPPGPISPLPEYVRVIQYAKGLIPSWKVLSGISTTAYDWPIPDTPENKATSLSGDDAVALAISNQVPIQYDDANETPFFRYVEGKQSHEVWFEDARSLMAKLRAIIDSGIAGPGIWHLGAHLSQLPPLIDYFFTVTK